MGVAQGYPEQSLRSGHLLQFDLPILIKEHAKNSGCRRTAFFLAVMHHNVGHLEEAFQAYGQRLTMGGTPEELYESHLRRVSFTLTLRQVPPVHY